MAADPHAFGRYTLTRAETKAAVARHDHAGVALELARIRERLAEVHSQHEPMAKVLGSKLDDRQQLYAIAFYVVIGRFPEQITEVSE